MEKQEKDNAIELFKMKRLFKRLQEAKIDGSVITIVIPPKKTICQMTKLLVQQIGKSANIKDRTNKNSVTQAQTAARQRLKLYQRAPNNGLILFAGRIMEQGSKTQKKIVYDFEPYKPINLSIYDCSSKFLLHDLKQELLANQPPFGFIVVDGQGALFATLQGNTKKILYKFSVDLPKKHNKGGWSSERFARIRLQARHNYLRKVCQYAVQTFITDNKCNVKGLILAGSANFKNDLNKTDMFDPRVQTKVVSIVDVSYGFQNGLNQAIEKSIENLQNVKFIKEKALISDFFSHIAQNDGLVVYGIQDTMKMIETGTVKKIICFQELNYLRFKLKNTETGSIKTVYVKPEQLKNSDIYKEGESILQRVDNEQQVNLAQWIAINYSNFGCQLQFVTDKSPQGTQFCKGFAGLGGFLRYQVEMEHVLANLEEQEENDNKDDDDDYI